MTLALVTLLLAWAPSAARSAAPPAAATTCQTFTRAGAAAAPPLVRGWFADSGDERVLVCPQPGQQGTSAEEAPLYWGEGSVIRRGAVCSYLSHGLTAVGAGAARRLRREERTEAVAMALAGEECPVPHEGTAASAYVTTYDTSRAAFVSLMQLWSRLTTHDSVTSAAAPAAASTTAMLERLRAAIEARRLQPPGVTRIVRIPGSALRRRYALFVKDPDRPAQSAMYVIYVQKKVRAPYEVTDVAESN